MNATALIAEDEPLLAANLQAELAQLWPDLRIVANVAHGQAAFEQGLALQPDLLFLDIRMPGMTGIEAAQALAEDWPESGKPFPLIVFVTAYDQYALQAFERAAADYVLKPVETARLAQTVIRLQAALKQRQQQLQPQQNAPALDTLLCQLRELVGTGISAAPATNPCTTLRVIQVSIGNVINMVPVNDIFYFEAADKYVRVITAMHEHLIRTSLRELQQQLDPHLFWQIHRSVIVRADAIASAIRDESGKLTLILRGHADKLNVSRLYADRFKGM